MEHYFIEGLLMTITTLVRAVSIIILLGLAWLAIALLLEIMGFAESSTPRKSYPTSDTVTSTGQPKIVFRDGKIVDPKMAARRHNGVRGGVRGGMPPRTKPWYEG